MDGLTEDSAFRSKLNASDYHSYYWPAVPDTVVTSLGIIKQWEYNVGLRVLELHPFKERR